MRSRDKEKRQVIAAVPQPLIPRFTRVPIDGSGCSIGLPTSLLYSIKTVLTLKMSNVFTCKAKKFLNKPRDGREGVFVDGRRSLAWRSRSSLLVSVLATSGCPP